jgi:hypothetical protein
VIRVYTAGDTDDGLREAGVDIAAVLAVVQSYVVLHAVPGSLVMSFCETAAEAAALAHDMARHEPPDGQPMRVPGAVAVELDAIAAGLH